MKPCVMQVFHMQLTRFIELAAHGVDGVHIYTMNDPYVARRISEGVKNILKSGK